MENRCNVCGNVGVADALITCSKCKLNTEHMYCMRILLEKARDDWICDDCESGHKPQKDLKLLNEPRKGSTNWEKKVDTGKTKYISAKEAIMLSSGAPKSAPSLKHKLDSGPSRQLKKQRAGDIDISEGKQKQSNTLASPKKVQLLKEHPAKGKSPQTKPASVRKESSYASAFSPNVLPVSISAPINERMLKEHPAKSKPSQTKEKSVKELYCASAPVPNALPVTVSAPLSEQVLKEHPAEGKLPQTKAKSVMKEPSSASARSPNASPVIISGGNGLSPAEPGTSNGENVTGNVLPDSEKHSCSRLLDALWKGSFCVQDDLIYGELNLQAHPPYRVSKKAYEFSKTMPRVLHFELVPFKELQIHFFEEYSPDRRDIGLYFFSSHKERKYFSLMEYISLKNCALRKQFGDVELLVFSSQLLPEDCQRFEGTYFLWGVFHHLKRDPTAHLNNTGLKLTVQPSDSANYGHSVGDNDEEVDMDIDMIGGVNVGRVDVPVQRKPLQEERMISGSVKQISVSRDTGSVTRVPSTNVNVEPCADVPPGFEEMYRLRAQNSLSVTKTSEGVEEISGSLQKVKSECL